MSKARQRHATLGGSPDDIEAAFYEALQTGDLEKLMGCWADEDDIVCIHPGGPRIVTAVEEALGLDTSATAASRAILDEYGNMSSPTILFVIDRLRRGNAPRPCVAIGFGPGLNAEVALFL